MLEGIPLEITFLSGDCGVTKTQTGREGGVSAVLEGTICLKKEKMSAHEGVVGPSQAALGAPQGFRLGRSTKS